MNRKFHLVLLLLAAAYTSDAATLARRPYLQDVRPTQAAVLWTTAGDAGVGEVVLSRDGTVVQRTASAVTVFEPQETGLDAAFYQHRVVLAGLQPDTLYTYRVLVNGIEVIARQGLEFRTSGPVSAFQFLVVGDSGDGASGQEDVARLLLQEQASLLLHTGDLAYFDGTFQQMEDYYFRMYWPLMRRVPFFAIPGNHDYHFRDGMAYRSANCPQGTDTFYSFDWGNVHFAGLDSNQPFADALNGPGQMLNWLDRDLAATRAMWRVVYFHHTPFATAAHRGDAEVEAVLRHITPILERHQVHLVFTGHEHLYQRTLPRRDGVFVKDSALSEPAPGTVYITTGGGGSTVYDPGNDSFVQAGAGKSHFLRVSVDGALMTVQAVDRFGAVLDSFRLSAAPAMDPLGIRDAAAGGTSLAAGGLIALYGMNLAQAEEVAAALPWPKTMRGARVLVNDQPAPLLFVSRRQINTQLPFGVTGDLRVTVTTAAGSSTQSARAALAAPAIFQIPVGNQLVPAIIHLSGELVSPLRPARAGEWIALFMIGLGPVSPPLIAGDPAPLSPLAQVTLPLRVFAGGVEAEVSYAGLAPGFAGLYQVNFRVPQGAGNSVRIEVGGAATSAPLFVE